MVSESHEPMVVTKSALLLACLWDSVSHPAPGIVIASGFRHSASWELSEFVVLLVPVMLVAV